MSATPQSPPLNRDAPSPPPQTSQTIRLALGTLLIGALAVLTYAVTPTFIGLVAMQRGAAALAVAERVHTDPATLEGLIGDLRHAAALLPNDPLPLRYLARAYQQSGRPEEAIAALEPLPWPPRAYWYVRNCSWPIKRLGATSRAPCLKQNWAIRRSES